MAAEQVSDQELQFKKRARRRLVGAVALVLLMVTILPMVMDDYSAKSKKPEIAINIPSQNISGQAGEFSSKIVPLETSEDAPVSQDEAPSSETVTKPDSAVPTAVPTKDKQNPVVKDSEAIKPAEAGKPESKITKIEVKEAKKVDLESKPAKTLSESAANSISKMVVQIGVFSDIKNVQDLQSKISKINIQSYTEKIATPKGEKIRLRAGPFNSREDAQVALEKIKSAGLNGIVVSQ